MPGREDAEQQPITHWLMKAEPDSRIVKGKDVAFSVDDFEKIGTSPWDGVRNPEAKNIMKEKMKVGHGVLFYHSNTKVPGVAAIAEVAREGYPDHTAWDASHPYFDPKSDKDNPKWYMVDVRFVSRLAHFVPLAFLQHIASSSPSGRPDYLTEEHASAIRDMALLNRGRLSVQSVSDLAFEAVKMVGEKGLGGWDGKKGKGKGAKAKENAEVGGDRANEKVEVTGTGANANGTGDRRKRKEVPNGGEGLRRSKRKSSGGKT